MIAVSIGAQLFNSWQANKKTEELQARQREFQRAAQQKEFDYMRQLQREAAQLALEIEADVHKQRLEDIEANYDDVVKQYSNEIAIKKWPLKVLPFVMRGESFGTFFNGTKSIALHVILTPSNCDRFNEAVYMDIDLELEAACNKHWNAQTSHPIAYYGGAWRKPTLDLDHIDLLKTQLKNVPTVVITPYFGPELYFRVKMWGMGKDTEVKIELPNDLFSYDYEKGMNYSPKDENPKGDLIDTTIEEFVPYLECLIGYIADTYFWEMYKITPILPILLENKHIQVGATLIEKCRDIYIGLYNTLVLKQQSITERITTTAVEKKDIGVVLNNRQLQDSNQIAGFLYSAIVFSKDNTLNERLIFDTIFQMYNTRTNLQIKSIQDIDTDMLVLSDIDIISHVVRISNACGLTQINRDLIEVLKRKIAI